VLSSDRSCLFHFVRFEKSKIQSERKQNTCQHTITHQLFEQPARTAMIFINRRRNIISAPVPAPRKGVRFDDQRNQVLEIQTVITLEEGIVEKLWYQSWEHKDNKRAIKEEAHVWRKTGMGILLRDTFASTNASKTQRCLNAFVQLADGDYVRGIERHLSQQHDQQRVQGKRNFVQNVLEQARYLESHPFLTDDEKRNKLAQFSALQSKVSEVFARRLGKADETVALQGEDPKAAAKLVSKLFRNEMRRTRSLEEHANVMPTHESRRRTSVPSLASGAMMMGF
jgi:hypothetical protein